MKLKEVLDLVAEISTKIRRARCDVRYCEECEGSLGEIRAITQEEHTKKHHAEVLELLDRLPHSLQGYTHRLEQLRLGPEISLKVDETGHIIVDVWDVDVQ